MGVNTNSWNRLRYTVYAPIYDRIASFAGPRERSIRLLELRPGEKVLIDGAGTGADLEFIPASVDITATDITPAMVERISARATQIGRTVDARVMDAHALQFPQEHFDAAILHLILAVVPDPVQALREVARVLKPGGRAVVFDKFVPDSEAPSLGRRALNLVTNLLFSDVTRRLGPIAHEAGLAVTSREPAFLGRAFEIALLRK